MIKKRYLYFTEEMLKENPNMCEYMAPSLDARQDMVVVEVPKLGKEAAKRAIEEWGQPKSKITHLIFCTSCGVDMPGADYQLTKLLGLHPSVKRVMMYQQGCFASAMVLRLAKDLAENNKGAHVLVVCSEITAISFRGPSDTHLDSFIGAVLFGDGVVAVIVGSDPKAEAEKPLFELMSTAQTIISIVMVLSLDTSVRLGLHSTYSRTYPGEAFQPLDISYWNSLFWIAHPGGPAILDQVEEKLALKIDKLCPTRHVLSEYRNISTACVFFIMNEMRKSSAKKGLKATDEGLEWGFLLGFGPGITIDAVVLHSVSI
ncbi:hypothetical protein RJ639_002109 [Escallonia herrerae]|uniref:chalcone synthase n=1 Tax=Escallonia herrerae TaxID=1293975 RepID=A0AA89BIE9_9ASTE|nr:hypothetical protein RJ639_002109 [Escallonia herrerae]